MHFTDEDLEDIFTYHPPRLDQIPLYNELREAAKVFAKAFVRLTPASADQSAGMRKIREAVMSGNSAIANDGKY